MNEKNRKTLLIQTYFVNSKNTSGNFFYKPWQVFKLTPLT